MQVDIYSDIACPWCYIGAHRFRIALETFAHRDSVNVRWRAYELNPHTPRDTGRLLIDDFAAQRGMSTTQVAEMFATVTDAALPLGLTLDFAHVIAANTFDAHRLVHYAANKSPKIADRVHESLWQAHFSEGLAIDNHEVLTRIAAAQSLDAAEVHQVLTEGTFGEDVRTDQAQAAALGITGVPFFVIDDTFAISGAQTSDVFSAALTQAWQQSHPLIQVADPAQECGPDGCAVPQP